MKKMQNFSWYWVLYFLGRIFLSKHKRRSNFNWPGFEKNNAGFTLVELLIYLALFGIILGGVCGAVYSLLEFSGKNQSKIILQEEGNYLLNKFDWALSGANDVIVKATPNELIVNKYNFLNNPLTFSINGTNLNLKRGEGPGSPLNSSQVRVAGLVVQKILNGNSETTGVKIIFNLQTTTSRGNILSQNFHVSYFYANQFSNYYKAK